MRFLSTWLFLLLLIPSTLTAKSTKVFFAQAVASNDGNIQINNAITVDIILYAVAPIGDIKIDDKKLNVKNSSVKLLSRNQRVRQSIVQIKGRNYYKAVCARYLVTGNKIRKTHFPSLSITANLYQEVANQNPFFDSFFYQPTYKTKKVSTRSKSLNLNIVPAPQKTIEQLKKQGKRVI